MTAQQSKTIRDINEQIEADCFIASQASREQAELDAVSVFYAVQVKLAEGRIDEAKAIYLNWKKGN